MTDPFGPALQALTPGAWSCMDPTSFRDYLSRHHIPKRETAQMISVDFLEKLAPSLRDSGAMVLRLGQGQFALVGTPGRLGDFFLHHRAMFVDAIPEPFPLHINPDIVSAYKAMGTLTEPTLVHLAFATGLIGHALGLDPVPREAPATGASTYEFHFRPHSEMDKVFHHPKGQVEIDAIFVGRRNNERLLFVVEAKYGGGKQTLAKHKLVYPILAVAKYADTALPIIPIYLFIERQKAHYIYHMVECSFPDPRTAVRALDELHPVTHRCFRLVL